MRNNVLVIICLGIWNHNRRGGEQKERLGANVRDMSRLSGNLKATVFCWLKEAWSLKVKEPGSCYKCQFPVAQIRTAKKRMWMGRLSCKYKIANLMVKCVFSTQISPLNSRFLYLMGCVMFPLDTKEASVVCRILTWLRFPLHCTHTLNNLLPLAT